jgi:hypothetical protein
MPINLNPFSGKFLRTKDGSESAIEKEIAKNSQGVTVDDLVGAALNYSAGQPNGPAAPVFVSHQYDHAPIIVSKRHKVKKYREMSIFPEISDALDIICDEALPEDTHGKVFEFSFHNEGDIKKNIKPLFKKEFDYVINNVFKATKRSRAWQFLRRFMIDGELYAELISNDKGSGLVGIKMLPTVNMCPVYNGAAIEYFMQYPPTYAEAKGFDMGNTEDKALRLESNQVSYINYIDYGQDYTEVRGYLESSRRVYNHLKNLEDATVIYQLVRAPERRLWNVDMGKLPPGQQENALKNLIQKYRRNINYDSATGEINSNYNVQSMVEDYWFAKGMDGKGTSVDVLQGGQAFSDMGSLQYMQAKLYKVLKVPRTRWDSDKAGPYMAKKSGETEREEIKFSNFVKRIQGMYRDFVLQIYFQHLRMKLPKEYHKYINTNYLDIQFVMYNEFAENRRIEQVNERLGIYSQLSQDIITEENLGGTFAEEFVLKDLVGFTDEQYEKHLRLKNRDKAKFAAAAAAANATSQEEDLGDYESGTGAYGEEPPQAPK